MAILRSYGSETPSDTVVAIAREITDLLVSRSVTYKEAERALETALDLLQETKPVIR